MAFKVTLPVDGYWIVTESARDGEPGIKAEIYVGTKLEKEAVAKWDSDIADLRKHAPCNVLHVRRLEYRTDNGSIRKVVRRTVKIRGNGKPIERETIMTATTTKKAPAASKAKVLPIRKAKAAPAEPVKAASKSTTRAVKLPVAKKTAASKPESAETTVLWNEDTSLAKAVAALRDHYAVIHGKTSNEYKALLRRTFWYANAGNRWYIAFEGPDGKVWFFDRSAKHTASHDEWPDKYDYYTDAS